MRVRKDTVILERRYVPKGTVVIKQGEYGAQAYLIQSGAVRVFVTHDDKTVELAQLKTGEIFGEMALIFDGPRTASIEATQDCNLIVITRQQFTDKLKSTDPTIRAVVNMMARRLLEGNNTLINNRSNLEALKDAGRVMYQNIASGLSPSKLRVFQSNVLPKLEALIETIDAFDDRYGDMGDADGDAF